MRILRIYNNNVVLAAQPNGEEAVMIGRGLGFGKRKGQILDPTKVEQTFVPEPDALHQAPGEEDRLATMLAEIPADILALATELERIAREQMGLKIAHSFIIPLADHIHFAIQRARRGITVDYPLSIEVAQLYPQETAFGHRAVELVAARTGVVLPESEATPLALHLVNSQFAAEDLASAFRMTELLAQIFGIISSAYGHPVDQSHVSVARFVTHVRYLFVRHEQGTLHRSPAGSPDLTLPAIHDAVRTGYPRAFACAYKVMLLLEVQLGQAPTQDEHTYLTIHIARLAQDLWGEDSAGPERRS